MSTQLLYLDTSAGETRVSWFDDDVVRAERVHPESRDHGLHIHQFIDAVCLEIGKTLHDVDGIVVMNGPGSYTGLRIALSVAKGFCYALNKPLVLLNKLDVCAKISVAILSEGNRAVAVQARTNEFFFCRYNAQGGCIGEAEIIDTNTLQAVVEPIFSFQPDLKTIIPACYVVDLPSAFIAKLSFVKYNAAELSDIMDAEPFYLKNVYINKINKL